jgi:hypothetical protein
MTNIRKDTAIQVLGSESNLVKSIKLSNDKKQIVLYQTSDGSELGTIDIDSSSLGIELINQELYFRDAFSGLGTNGTLSIGPDVQLLQTDGSLHIIGIDDTEINFAAPKTNVRYDAATNSIKYQK